MDAKQEIIERLQKITRHNHVKLTCSGNAAIMISLIIAKHQGKDTVLIPDQGGWLTYLTFPDMLGLKTVKVKTDYGLIDLDDLNQKAQENCCFVFASLAGYIVEQPLKQISEICRNKGCIVIEDSPGAIGHKELCNGNYSDMVVGSFGKWKPVNLRYGGFISTNKEWFKIDPELWIMLRMHEDFYDKLIGKLDMVHERYKFLYSECEKIKNDLKSCDIIHSGGKGLNVVVRFKSDEEKLEVVDYCKKNGYEFTVCPRYIRVIDDAISIEVKRLEG